MVVQLAYLQRTVENQIVDQIGQLAQPAAHRLLELPAAQGRPGR